MEERWSEYLADFPPNWLTKPGWEMFEGWRHPDPASGYRQMATKAGFQVLCAKVILSIIQINL